MFIQADEQGALPLLNQSALTWKEQVKQQPDDPKRLNLQSHLLACLLKELNARVVRISQSQAGQPLWDMAKEKGNIQADGS